MKNTFIILLMLLSLNGIAQKKSKKDYLVTLSTNKGDMHLILFDEAPLHKANFLAQIDNGTYSGSLFHRVKNKFMIQGGDPSSKNAKKGARLGSGGREIPKVPYEFDPKNVHTKGALAAARGNNPAKESSGCQFYIVLGDKQSLNGLNAFSRRNGITYTEDQLSDYQELGGYPSLDNNYTVFGQVISGIEIAEEIEEVATDRFDRPLEDVAMEMSYKKMSKKKITKRYAYTFEK